MTSLARGLAVIHAFQERKRHLTIAQISHRTEIPAPPCVAACTR